MEQESKNCSLNELFVAINYYLHTQCQFLTDKTTMKNKLISKQSNELLTYFNGKNQHCFDNKQTYQALPNSKENTVRELLNDMSNVSLKICS